MGGACNAGSLSLSASAHCDLSYFHTFARGRLKRISGHSHYTVAPPPLVDPSAHQTGTLNLHSQASQDTRVV